MDFKLAGSAFDKVILGNTRIEQRYSPGSGLYVGKLEFSAFVGEDSFECFTVGKFQENIFKTTPLFQRSLRFRAFFAGIEIHISFNYGFGDHGKIECFNLSAFQLYLIRSDDIGHRARWKTGLVDGYIEIAVFRNIERVDTLLVRGSRKTVAPQNEPCYRSAGDAVHNPAPDKSNTLFARNRYAERHGIPELHLEIVADFLRFDRTERRQRCGKILLIDKLVYKPPGGGNAC